MTDVYGQPVEASPPPRSYTPNDEIDLWALLRVLWEGKWIIISLPLLAGVVAFVFSMLMPNIYRSEALLAPAEESSSAGLMALAGQLGGLASLAGVDFGKAEATKVTIALEVLKSRAFLSSFIKRRDVLVPLLAAKAWSSAKGRLVLDDALYDGVNRSWIGFGDGADAKPSEWKAYQEFVRIMRVSQSKDTGLITLSIDHLSPKVAQQWVTWLIEDVNDQMRQRDIEEAQRSMEYLKQQVAHTALSEMQQIFYQLIERQIQTIMLANVREQYVFKVIDPPVVSEEKVSPRRASIVIMSIMAAFVVAVGFVLSLAAYRNAGRRPAQVDGNC